MSWRLRAYGPISRRWLAFVAVGLVAILVIVGHDFWRDEYQAWVIAREAGTPLDLWARLRFEGHPPLYYLLIWPLAHAGLPPESAKLVVLPAYIGGLYLLIVRLPAIPLFVRLAIASSVVLTEGVLAQPYALIPLLLLGSEVLASERATSRRRFLSWVLLGLAAATNLGAAAIGGVLALDRLRRGRAELPAAGAAFAIAVVGLAAAFPVPGAESVSIASVGVTPTSLGLYIARIAGPLVYRISPIVGLAACLLVLIPLRREDRVLMALGLAALAPIVILSGATGSRHATALMVLFAILLSRAGRAGRLDGVSRLGHWRPLDLWPRLRDLRAVAVAGFFGVMMIGGLIAFGATLLGDRSMANDAARWLEGRREPDTNLVVTPDYLATAFAVILDRPAWTPECGCDTTAVYWTKERNRRALDRTAMIGLAVEEAIRRDASGQDVVLVLPADEVGPTGWELAGRFVGGRSADEDVSLWRSPTP